MNVADRLPAAAMRSRASIKLVFLVHAVATGSMFTRIPDIQLGLGLDEAALGAVMIGQPVGAILMFLVASRIVERIGTRRLLAVGLPALSAGVLLMALAPSPVALFVAFFGFSALFAVTNVAMNVEADRVEAASGKRLMNTCHGLWSIGQLAAVSLGVVARGMGIPPSIHFGIFVPLTLLAALIVVLPMQEAPARAHSRVGKRHLIALPTLATLTLVGFMMAGSLVEAASRNWSVIYMRDSFLAPDWVDTLTLPVFIGATALGRFFADGAIARFGPVRVARSLALLSLSGLAVVVTAPVPAIALLGFLLAGIGVCVSFPLTTSAAAQLGDRPASENVAALTMTMQTILLGAPALLGAIAEHLGIRMTFAIILPIVVLSIWLARYLAPRR
jgi:MFS family permease